MGQRVSSQCGCQENSCAGTGCSCQESIFHFCSPEDPCKESQNTLPSSPMPGTYPMPTLSERGLDEIDLQMRLQSGGGFDFTVDDAALIDAPPHLLSARSTPKGGQQVAHQNFIKPCSPTRQDVTVEDILADLERSEEALYSDAFARFPGCSGALVGLDSAAMREFLCTNSAITMETIDMELLIISSAEEGLSASGFLHLLREFSVSDSDSIAHFIGLSINGDTLSAEECRTGLLLFAQQKLSSNFTDERWDHILDTVMWDACMMVTLEQWICYCKVIGRILRLLRYMQVRKLALGPRKKTGVIGGA